MYRILSCCSFILVFTVEIALSQAAYTVQTFVGQNASFSFNISNGVGQDNLLSIQHIWNGNLIMIYNGNVSYIGSYMNRLNYTGNTNERRISFVLRNVTLTDAGKYMAILPYVSQNSLGDQTLIVKASPSKPQIVELNGPAVALLDYHLNCSTQSNSKPPNHNLSMLSEWRRDNILIPLVGRYIVIGTKLTITSLKYGEDDRARLTCVAFEDQLAESINSDEFIIDVKYGPENIMLSPPTPTGVITEMENGQIIVNCTADCNPLCSFQWRKDSVSLSLSTNHTLLIKNVSKNNSGRYLCNISNNITGRSQTAQIIISIIHGPASANILSTPSDFPLKVEENGTLIITCTADCYPECNFMWSGPQGFIKNGSQLSQVMVRDNEGNYTCIATNQVNMGKIATTSVLVLVFYGPGNSINIGISTPTLGIDVHQRAPDITCSSTCNPPCDYRWYQNGTFYTNGATLSLGIVNKTMRGNYRCEAYTSVLGVNRSSYISVNITVYYAPEVLLQPAVLPRPNVYILKLGQRNVGLKCAVIDASPSPQWFIWTKDGQEILNQTYPTFTIPMVTKDSMGTWGCKGVNSKGNPLESYMEVDVHYGPIIANLPNVTIVEGDPLNVTCIVDSRPHPSSTSWTKSQNNTFNKNTAEMYIAHLSRADKGTYECTTVNTIQPTGQTVGDIISVMSSYTLEVTYGARIFDLSVRNDTTVNENSSAVFQCRIDSNPPSNITWMKESNRTFIQTVSGVLQSLYRIESAECLDMDNYTCSAYNGIWTASKETVPFFVRCHPRTDFRATLETKVYRKRHESAVLRYTVIAYPHPTFSWTFIGNGSESRGLPVSAIQHDNGLQSELWLSRLGIHDFGNYSVIADNKLPPSSGKIFEIIPADVPEVPSNVMVVQIKQNSVTVQWSAGNNGGLQQIFHIVATAGSHTANITAADPGYGTNVTAVLEGLLPKTKYIIYIKASNSVGSSNITDIITVTTLEDLMIGSGNMFPLSVVAGSIGGGIAVIILVIVALFLWRRYQQSDDIKQDISERPRPESGMVDNPVYDSSGSVPSPSVNNGATGVEYDEVIKPNKKASKVNDASNIYAQVNKTKKNLKKGAEKGKHGQISRGDIYENADLVVNCTKHGNLYKNSENAKAESCGESVYEYTEAAASNGPLKNKDGLLYADLMLDPPTTENGKYIIRGIENSTVYAEIAYGKKGEPIPDHEKDNSDARFTNQ